jgi:hypothetical protein
MSRFADIACAEGQQEIKVQPQDGKFDSAHESQFKTFITNLERRTSGGHIE